MGGRHGLDGEAGVLEVIEEEQPVEQRPRALSIMMPTVPQTEVLGHSVTTTLSNKSVEMVQFVPNAPSGHIPSTEAKEMEKMQTQKDQPVEIEMVYIDVPCETTSRRSPTIDSRDVSRLLDDIWESDEKRVWTPSKALSTSSKYAEVVGSVRSDISSAPNAGGAAEASLLALTEADPASERELKEEESEDKCVRVSGPTHCSCPGLSPATTSHPADLSECSQSLKTRIASVSEPKDESSISKQENIEEKDVEDQSPTNQEQDRS